MNKGKLLRGIGVAIALFGVLMMVYAVLPADDSYEATLPSGDYYYYFGYENLISGCSAHTAMRVQEPPGFRESKAISARQTYS